MDVAYKVEKLLDDFVKAVEEVAIDGLDLELAGYLVDTLEEICDAFLKKKNEDGCEDINRFAGKYLRSLLIMTVRSLGVFHAFRLNGKEDPEHIVASKKQCMKIIDALTELSDNPEEPYLKSQLPSIMSEFFSSQYLEHLGTFAVQSDKWRLYYALFDLMTPEFLQLSLEVRQPEEIMYKKKALVPFSGEETAADIKPIEAEDLIKGILPPEMEAKVEEMIEEIGDK